MKNAPNHKKFFETNENHQVHVNTKKEVHEQIIRSSCEADVFVGCSLVNMYAKCRHMKDAWRVFKNMSSRDVVTWNTMILGHVKCGQGRKALELFQQMLQEDVSVGNSLVNMYAKCGSMEDAQRVFLKMPSRDVVTWTAMILGHVKCGQGQKALDLFQQMQEQDIFVGSSLVDMYVKCGSMEDAQRVFNKIPSRDVVTWTAMIFGFVRCQQGQKALELFQQMQHEDVCVGNSLVDMYAKCGSIEDAWRVFNKMPSRDVVTWTTMMLGHLKCGQGQEALELFQQMQKEGVQPNSVTFVGALNACASVAALEEGRCAHERILQSEWHSNIFVGNSLVDMYGKCGSMEDAQRVFNNMPLHDVVSWNAILGGCAMHGHGKEALRHFELMCEEGVKPNDITFVCLLSACGHAGLVDEGLRCFTSMSTVYKISAKLEHYTCTVDLLGRSGRLQEAENMIQALPFRPDGALWMALLGACRIHANVEMGERIAKRVLELEPENASGYVLLSNIYAAAGKRDLCKNIERQRNERGVKKQLGRTWIEVNNEVHTFVVDDQKHPQISQIHAQLKRLSGLMHDAGYVPVTEFVLHDVEEESKVFHLCHHSEKLAIAFGLINTDPGTPLRIMKNLRVCEDCHTSTKFIAKLVGRTIMVRDANRFHHFQDGVCSCMDYW
ncbi:unnamed protein product [Sphagnum balticum]